MDSDLKELWGNLYDVPCITNEDDESIIAEDFHIWKAGELKATIVRWFDTQRPYDLKQELDNPDDYEEQIRQVEEAERKYFSTHKKLWVRLGVNLIGTDTEIDKLMNGNSDMLRHIVDRGTFVLTGESYIPADCITDYNKENQTNYSEEDVEFSDI